jgi:Glycine zipper 2TM domain
MTKSSTFAKGALAVAVGLVALGAAAAASAQEYGPGYSNYDPCRRDANNRGITGALVGGAGGAVLGSQLSARGHRTDGSLLGGVVGAIAGAAVGKNTAACTDAPPPPYAYRDAPPPPAYYEPEPQAYGEADYAPPPPPRYVERETVWAYGRHGARFRVIGDRVGPDGCTLAESPVYMPDGRVDHRFVRVCPDYSGRYRVVD